VDYPALDILVANSGDYWNPICYALEWKFSYLQNEKTDWIKPRRTREKNSYFATHCAELLELICRIGLGRARPCTARC
jgi:hypothetical protein